MENKEIKALKDAQLNEKMVELRKEQMNLRFQKATGQMENPNRWREVRKTIAKLKTEATARAAAATAN
ncbi:MAG: 50S ribosomal protein L29 [Magnetococcales bacterium]|jgi:large subunit ribosomal protein L29|nr:50S ribosomal protein L29 [Magnetococcales bacterium]MEC8067977.1 50S ribosomal protein L29 [Pseudomonadota bacterium]|tara:strand:- start:13673 stop:13876 length:204 start_codon:yes stop_codon:yes gene_type:complete